MLRNYFRIAFRNLFNNKVYGLLNIIGLALSLTCGLLIFVFVKYHLSFDTFHHHPERIYRFVTEQHKDDIYYSGSVPPALGPAFRQDFSESGIVARVANFDEILVSFEKDGELKKYEEEEGVAFAEPSYFDIFNYPLLVGNKDAAMSEPNTALITASLAKKYFGNEDPVNKVIKLDDKLSCRIAGILKDLPSNTDQRAQIFLSWKTVKDYSFFLFKDDAWGGIMSSLNTFTALKPGVSAANIEKQLIKYQDQRKGNTNVHIYKMQPLKERHFGARYGGVMEIKHLWILSFAGLFLVVAACLNFINLSTAQALRRSKEVGIRKVLGSFRGQLFWQFLMETGVIAVISTLVACVLGMLLLPAVNDLFGAKMQMESVMDWRLLVFILSMIVLVTFFAGSYPGLVLSGFRPVLALKGKVARQQLGSFNIRRSLIVTQFTITLVLIIGMLVITRQMQYATHTDLGFNKDAILVVPMGADSVDAHVTTIKNELLKQAGVKNVAICFEPPASMSNWNTNVKMDGNADDEPFSVSIKSADEQYVPTFGLQLVAGRNIFPDSLGRDCIVNETFMRKMGVRSADEMIGKRLHFNGKNAATIVGVAKDFHMYSMHADIVPVMITQYPRLDQNFAIKVNMAQLSTVLPMLEKVWTAQFPGKLYSYEFLDKRIAGFYETEEMMLKLVRIFSIIAIFIGCLGLYGMVSFMVMQKTKEIGIRKVLGSSVTEILWIFGKEFSLLIALAFLMAAPLAWWMMSQWLEDFKYHIALGPWMFLGAVGLTMLVAGLTISVQSAKAALMNPVRSLKME